MPIPILSLEESLYHYRAHVYEVTDGDTIKIRWDFGRRTFGDEIIRFSRVDAIEKKDPRGEEAKQYVKERILDKTIIIRTEQDKKGMDKYGGFNRFLGEIYYETPEGWINLNDELLEKGFAKYYK